MSRPAPFDGPQWDGWEMLGEGRPCRKQSLMVNEINPEEWSLSNFGLSVATFHTPEAARQVAECIMAARKGEQVGPVGELVEALRVAYLDGTWDGVFDILARHLEVKS